MTILSFESSAKAASVALVRDGELIAQYSQCCALTHSRTLLPMAEDMLKNTELTFSDVDLLACAYGPGSFTGIRKRTLVGTGKTVCGRFNSGSDGLARHICRRLYLPGYGRKTEPGL